MNFAKHGQSALQAANAINGGARLLVCRLVADDATLANVIMSATVTKTQTARKGTAEDTGVAVSAEDAEKILKGEEPSGATVDDPTTGFVVEPGSVTVKWTATSVTGCKTKDEVIEEALATKDIGEISVEDNEQQGKTATQTSVYPLIIACDNGRGVSNKSIKFTPDSTASKDMANMFYTVQIYDGTTRLEKTNACLNPACVVNNVSYSVTEDTSHQVQFTVDDTVYEEYINDLMGTLGVDEATIKKYDIIFCTDTKGSAVTNFNLDAESIDLNSAYGVNLQNGTNGEFGDAPFGTEAWTQAAVDVFEGVVKQIRLGDSSSSSSSSTSSTSSTVVTYEVVITAPNPDLKLKPRLTANITIYTLDRKDVLCVPSRALRFVPEAPLISENDIVNDCQAEHKVWTREGNVFTAHPVEIGISNGVNTEITGGLAEGTVIVTEATIGASSENISPMEQAGERSPFMPGPPGGDKKKKN